MNTSTAEQGMCRHHWLLKQPAEGRVAATCRVCGAERSYPAVLDDYDWSVEKDFRYSTLSVATAAGGARPSSTILMVDEGSS